MEGSKLFLYSEENNKKIKKKYENILKSVDCRTLSEGEYMDYAVMMKDDYDKKTELNDELKESNKRLKDENKELIKDTHRCVENFSDYKKEWEGENDKLKESNKELIEDHVRIVENFSDYKKEVKWEREIELGCAEEIIELKDHMGEEAYSKVLDNCCCRGGIYKTKYNFVLKELKQKLKAL